MHSQTFLADIALLSDLQEARLRLRLLTHPHQHGVWLDFPDSASSPSAKSFSLCALCYVLPDAVLHSCLFSLRPHSYVCCPTPGALLQFCTLDPVQSGPLLWMCTPALQDCGFEHPSEVQHQCIPQAILGQDLLCQAKSGMGKTAVFVLSTLQQLEETDEKFVHCLVLCHTRELAFQINNEFTRFSKHLPHAHCAVFYGGTLIAKDKEALNPKVIYLHENAVC